jgi:hypothetical protein
MFTTDGLILLSEEIEVKEFQERSLRPNLIKKIWPLIYVPTLLI